MALTQKDTKLLWGRSGNRCAICRIELSQDNHASGAVFTLGEQAHIVGEKDDAPRGRSSLSENERNSYHNLILLCPNHHTEVDRDLDRYSVEQLYVLKSIHELWVRETLADAADLKLQATQIIVTSVIDSAVELCDLANWKYWTQGPLSADPNWEDRYFDNFFEFRQIVAAAIWPDSFEELKVATTVMASSLHQAACKFQEHSEFRTGRYWPHKFYKAISNNRDYAHDLREYQKWLEECYELIYQSTRAANWFADVVRECINPTFFASTGKFIVIDGPFPPNLAWEAKILEFDDEEKKRYRKEFLE